MLILIVGRAQTKPLMLDLTSPAASKRYKGRIATDPLLTTRRFDERRLGIATKTTMFAGNRLRFHAIVCHHLSLSRWPPYRGCPPCSLWRCITPRSALASWAMVSSPVLPRRLWRPVWSRERLMSQLSKMQHSRNQWKHQATQRADQNRYQRKQLARVTHERDRTAKALKAAQARLRQFESQSQGRVARPKVDVVLLALQLFCVARIGFRAVSRVLSLLAWALGIKKAPCPQTISNWVMRLSMVRLESARTRKGLPLSQAPCTNGLIWMLDSSIGLGPSKILAVLACDAQHHQLTPGGALSLDRVHCIGVGVAASWSGDTIAEVLKRLIARMGRPVASLKDGGSELQKAVDLLGEQGLASPCLDDISHAVAGMLKRLYQDHPSFETFLSACGRVSGTLKHTILACLAPPKVRTKARFMNVHRLFTWADRLLKLSPAGGAKTGST